MELREEKAVENMRTHLQRALELSDDPEQKRHIRESLQLIAAL